MILDRRLLLRSVAGVLALVAVVLWILFAVEIFGLSGTIPAPSGIMLPLFYGGVAAGAAWAAIRDEPVVLVIAGGLSLVPGGLFLLMFPWPARGMALIDIALMVLGIALMRNLPDSEPRAPGEHLSQGHSLDVRSG